MAREKKSSFLGNVVFVAVLLAAGVMFLYLFMKPTDDPVLSGQSTADAALQTYLETASAFIDGRVHFDDLFKAVTPADREWFYDNYERLFRRRDAVGISTGVDPAAAGAFARRAIMDDVLRAGPYRPTHQVVAKDVRSRDAEYIVRKVEGFGDGSTVHYDCRVVVVLDGKYWKVKGFAGGRDEVEGRRPPGDFTEVPEDLVASGAPALRLTSGDGSASGPRRTPPPGFEAPPPSSEGAASFAGSQPPAAGAATLEDAQVLIDEAAAHWQAGRAREALDAATRALEIRTRLLGASHPDTVATRAMVDAAREQLP